MSQPASSPGENGGAPPVGGQAGGAGGLAPEYIRKKEEVESLRKRIRELRERYAATRKRLGLKEKPLVLAQAEAWLRFIDIYYSLVEIEQHIRANMKNISDEEWIKIKSRVDELIDELERHGEPYDIFYAVRRKAGEVRSLLLAINKTLVKIEREIEEVDKAVEKLAREIVKQEGL